MNFNEIFEELRQQSTSSQLCCCSLVLWFGMQTTICSGFISILRQYLSVSFVGWQLIEKWDILCQFWFPQFNSQLFAMSRWLLQNQHSKFLKCNKVNVVMQVSSLSLKANKFQWHFRNLLRIFCIEWNFRVSLLEIHPNSWR